MTSPKAAASKQSPDATHQRQKARPETASPVSGQVDPLGLRQALADPLAASPTDLLNLQRTCGNRAVQRMIQAKLTVGPAGGSSIDPARPCPTLTPLPEGALRVAPPRGRVVGPAGDAYEQEADRVAAQVMSAPGQSTTVQPSKDEEEVQRMPTAAPLAPVVQRDPSADDTLAPAMPPVPGASYLDGFEADSAVETRLAANQGRGTPLPGETRSFMESRFGADFDQVRVHTDGESARLNRKLGAQAFTHGSDIYMGAGKYEPGTTEGKRLLAHELTHVVQQGGGKPDKVQTKLAVGPAGDAYEQEADRVAAQVTAAPASAAPVVRRTTAVTPGPDIFFRQGADAPGRSQGQAKKAGEMPEKAQSRGEEGRPALAASIAGRGQAAAVIQRTIWRWSAHEQIWEPYYKTDNETYPPQQGNPGDYFDNETNEIITGEVADTRARTNQPGNLPTSDPENDNGIQPDQPSVNPGDWRLNTQGSQRLKLSKDSGLAYGCNEFNIRGEGLCHAAAMVRIAIELKQIDSLPETIQEHLEKLKTENQEMSSFDLYDTFMSEIVKLDNEYTGDLMPPLLVDFLGILDEQTEEKEDQKTYPKIKEHAQGGFIHITSLDSSDEEEINVSISQLLNEIDIEQQSKEGEWDSRFKEIRDDAEPVLNSVKDIALSICLNNRKHSLENAFKRNDFSVVLASLDKNSLDYEQVEQSLQPFVERRKTLGSKPALKVPLKDQQISLMGVKTKNTLGEKANQVFIAKLNSIILDKGAKVNNDLPIIIQLMVGMHVICLMSDENQTTTLVDDINCTKLTTLSNEQMDIFINDDARSISFSETTDESTEQVKNIIEIHAILFNVQPEKIPTSEQEHVEGWFKGNPKNKLYDPNFYKST